MRAPLALLLLAACSPSGAPSDPDAPIQYPDRNRGTAATPAPGAEGTGIDALRAARGTGDDAGNGVSIGDVKLVPEQFGVLDEVAVEAVIDKPRDTFLDVEYRWSVDGARVSGIDRDRVRVADLEATRGQAIGVEIRAVDAKGVETVARATAVRVRNTPPKITSNLTWRTGLDTVRLEAEDADGDPVAWSILSGPAGVTIDSAGTLRVRVAPDGPGFDGELVVAATDPAGARDELHVPVAINAAVAGKTEEKQVEKRVDFDRLDDEKAGKAAEEEEERVGNMSPAEFDAYMKERQQRGR